MSHAIPTDTRPLIDRLREAVPGLEWQSYSETLYGNHKGARDGVVAVHSTLYCWVTDRREPHAVSMDRPSDDEVVRIVKDWYAKTHPAKDQEKHQVEKLREAIERGAPGVTVQVSRIQGAFDLKCYGKAGHAIVSWRDGSEGPTAEQLEKTVAYVKEHCLKPLELDWAAALLERLHKETCGSWIITTYGPSGRAVSSFKDGKRFVITQADDGRYELEVSRKDGQPQRRSGRSEDEIIDLARVLCKSREDEMKPTNTIPSWALTARDRLNTETADTWLAECVEGFWQVSSAKNGQKLVATVVDGFFRLEVHEGSAVLPYRKLMLPELLELAKTLCKARNDLDIPEQAVRFAREMRDAGFEVETKQASTNESVHITVRSKATGKESRLHYGTLVGWTCDGVPNLTIGQANSRARLALTKPNNEASQEHEAFEKKAREATTQYPQNAGMAVANVTPTMTANAMVDLLASQGVEATIETIDDHAAVCVTDPSTGEVHKAICDPAGNWLMDGEEVYGLVAATELKELARRQKKEKAMGKSTRRQRIEQGIYLGAAKSATDKARDGVVALLASGLPAEEQAGARAVLAKILETEIGAGAFGFVMGEAVDLAAGQFEGESPKVEAFAEALQVVGAMRGANTVIDALFEPITSAISGMIAAIPEPPKVRATPDAPAEEHEEPAHTGRKARAQR